MYFLPESPRWLVAKDRHEEALRVLAKLHAGGDTNDLYVKAELGEIVAKIDFEKRHKAPSYFSLLFWRRVATHVDWDRSCEFPLTQTEFLRPNCD
jgi:hypothetical protein